MKRFKSQFVKNLISLAVAGALSLTLSVSLMAENVEPSEMITGTHSQAEALSSNTTKPLKPTEVKATALSTEVIKVTWNKVSNADGYEVYRFVNGKSVFYKAFDKNTTSFNNLGKVPSTTYYYKLRSYKVVDGKKIYSGYTDLVTCTTPSLKPLKPTNVKAVAVSTSAVKVTWDKVANADGYEVYRFVNGRSIFYKSIDKDTTSFNNVGKVPNTTYYYKMRSYTSVNGKKYYSGYTDLVTCKTPADKPATSPNNSVDVSKYNYTSKIGYNTLSTTEKTVYKEILGCLMTKSDKVQTSTKSSTTIAKVWKVVVNDYAEIFWNTSFGYNGSSNQNLFFVNSMIYSQSKIASMQNEIDSVVDKFVSNFYRTHSKNASDYEIAKAAYEFVIENTKYSISSSHNNQIAYSSLVEGATVCAGYTRALQVLLAEFDIPSYYVSGYTSGKGHAWNLVKLDGNYYYIDPTFGDLNTYNANISDVSYDYLCLTTEQMKATNHTFNANIPLPNCTKTNYGYFVHEGFYLEKYDYNKVLEIYKKQYKAGETLVVQFGSSTERSKAMSDLIYGQKIWYLLDTLVGHYYTGRFNYYNNSKANTLTLYLS